MKWICALALASLVAGQEPADLWRRYAEQLPKPSKVTVRVSGEGRFAGTLLSVDDTAITVSPNGRVRPPDRRIPFSEILELEPRTEGRSAPARFVVGTLAGLAVFYGILGILVAGSTH